MKNNTILVTVFLLIFYASTAQEIKEDVFFKSKEALSKFLTEKVWEIRGGFGSHEVYNLKEYVASRSAGFKLTFSDTMSFISSYSDSCGNGTGGRTISGSYRIISTNKIEIIVKIDVHDGFKLPIEKLEPKKIIYIISKSENVLVFTKSN